MSLFNQMIRGGNMGGNYDEPAAKSSGGIIRDRPRTFKETIADQIAYHQAKIADLEAVRDSLTPEVEKFVEAIQKLG